MNNTLIDQLEINVRGLLGDRAETLTPKNALEFKATLTGATTAGSDKTALLQVSIAQRGTETAQLTAILDTIGTKFSSLAILIDMELVVLVYSIILPYMPKEQIKEIVAKRKLTWVTEHISVINSTAIPWSVITDKEESIAGRKSKNISKIKDLLKSDREFANSLQKDIESFKQYLISTHSITPTCYNQAEEKNDKAIEDYLISRMATIEAMHDFNSDKYDYIALNNMHSYAYLQKAVLPDLPECLTIELTQVGSSKGSIPSSTEVNQKLHDLNLLDKITERKSYLENSIKNFPGNVYIESLNRTFLACNKRQCQALGTEDETFLDGKTFDSILSQNESNILANIVDDVVAANETKVLIEHYTLLGKKNKYLSIKMPLRNKKNKTIGIIGFTLDMKDDDKNEGVRYLSGNEVIQQSIDNDCKNSSAQSSNDKPNLTELIKHMPGHVFWQSADGNIICTNHYQAVFLGFKHPDDLIGKPLSQFLTETHAKASQQHIDEIIKTGDPITAEEIYKTPDGLIAMSSHKTPVNDANGKIIGVMTVSFDISESKQRELKLEREKEKLAEADKFKRQFMQDLESELHTPFTEICSLTDACAEAEDDMGKKAQLNEISNCAKSLLKYCNSLMEFSYDASLRQDPIILREFIDSITNTSIVAIKAKQLEFKLDFDNRLPETVIGDSYRLSRILSNLIGNATKFTDSGYIKLAVKLKSAEQNNITILFTVTDTGIGISKEKQNKVFNKYSMLNHEGRDLATGQGLGLNEVKRLTEDLEGEISLESEEHKGTSIMVKLTFLLSEEI